MSVTAYCIADKSIPVKAFPLANNAKVTLRIKEPRTQEQIEEVLFYDWRECLYFFKDREKYHQESARWYFKYSQEMEIKAERHIFKAKQAHENYSHYLDLLAMGTLKQLKRGGVSHAG